MPGSVTPEQDSKPTFDPMIVLNDSAEEMEAVQLQPWEKNYCADLHIKAKVCHHENPLTFWKCAHIRHEVEHCLQDDYRLRMMEYERERRLRQRAKRIAAKNAAEGLDDE